jgi:hypothetical protein
MTTRDRIPTRKERIDRGIKVSSDGMYAMMSWRELAYLTLPRLVLDRRHAAAFLWYARHVLAAGHHHHLYLRPAGPQFRLSGAFCGAGILGGAFFVGTGGYLAAILNTSFRTVPFIDHPPGHGPGRRPLHPAAAALPAAAGGLFCHRQSHVSLFAMPGSSRRWIFWAARTASWESTVLPTAGWNSISSSASAVAALI